MNCFLYTLVFLSDLSKHWNSGPYKRWNYDLIDPNIGILILSFQTLEFWPYIFINIEILIFSLH